MSAEVWAVPAFIFSILALAADLWSTRCGLAAGGAEVNPVVRAVGGITVNAAAYAFAAYLAWSQPLYAHQFWILLGAIHTAAALWNLYQLRRI